MALTILDIDGAPPSPVMGGQAGKADAIKQITFDNSYATGGKALLPSAFGLAGLDFVDANPASGYTFRYDHTNAKLLAYRSGAANGVQVEESNAVDLSAVVTRVWARGARL